MIEILKVVLIDVAITTGKRILDNLRDEITNDDNDKEDDNT